MSTLREARIARKLTLTQVERDLLVDTGNLSRIERGIQTPSLAVAVLLARYYNLTLEQVFGVDDESQTIDTNRSK